MSGQITATNKTSGYEITGTTSGDKRGLDVANIVYKTMLDEASASITYVGKAAAGSLLSASVWQILKLEQVGTVLVSTHADGNTNFDNVWDNRASLTYS